MKKFMCLVIVILSFAVALLLYLWIDRSITLSYVDDSLSSEMRFAKILQKFIELEFKGISEQELSRKIEGLQELFPADDLIVKKEGDVIWVDSIPFQMKKGRLESVGVILGDASSNAEPATPTLPASHKP